MPIRAFELKITTSTNRLPLISCSPHECPALETDLWPPRGVGYRSAAKAPARTAKLLRLHSRADPLCSHRRRVALEGTRSPHKAMSTSGRGAVIDRMDTTTDPSPGSQGAEPPPSPGPRDEAGAADGGNRPGASQSSWTRNLQANERRADGCQPREMRSQNSFILLCGYCRGRERREGGN